MDTSNKGYSNDDLTEEEKFKRSIPPLTKIDDAPKLLPNIDPGFCGHPTLSNFDETSVIYDSVEVSPIDERFTPEFMESIKDTILGFPEVKRILENKKFIFIGTSQIEDKTDKENSFLVSILYNYTDNITVEISHDSELKKIRKMEQLYYQPAATREEIKQAIDMVKNDNYFHDKNLNDMEGGAIVVDSIDMNEPYYNHRLLDVRFRYIHERLPLYQALVDLSSKSIIKSGLVCSCDQSSHDNNGGNKIG